jgi:acyl-CoA reductase-like NAD-dependent aldehyde dehydrogenase
MSTSTWEFASDHDAVITLANPARPTQVVTHPTSTASDIDAAVAAARAVQGDWSRLPALRRAESLNRIAQSLRSRADALARSMLLELGKPLADGLGEVANAANVFDYYAAVLVTRADDTSRSIGSSDQLATRRYPLGVVAAITPWNFPVNIAAVKLAPALAFGNAVVLKPSPQAVASTQALVDAIFEAGALPDGLIGLVHGAGAFAAEHLIRHEHVAGVTFTGSTAVGRRIMVLAAEQNIPAQCEMGGNNAAIVLADADLARAVSLVVDGAFRLAGQRCTATSRVIVEQAVYPEFLEQLLAATRDLQVGDPARPGVLVGPLVNADSLRAVERAVEAAVGAGAAELAGVSRATDLPGDAYFYPPTILELGPGTTVGHEEVFGPVLTIQPAADLAEAIAIANDSPYGLAAAICTTSIAAAQRFVDEVEAGAVSVNGSTAGWQYQQAFGGWKDSGAGIPEQGASAELFFTRQKTVRVQWAAE